MSHKAGKFLDILPLELGMMHKVSSRPSFKVGLENTISLKYMYHWGDKTKYVLYHPFLKMESTTDNGWISISGEYIYQYLRKFAQWRTSTLISGYLS